MRDPMRKALDFAIAKELEAEAFYKEWAEKAKDPAVHALFAELAGVEHGHRQMLLRITPEEMVERGRTPVTDADLSDVLVDIDASASLSVQEAMIVAMKREQGAVNLYRRLSEFGGKTKPLFEALAKEEQRHQSKLQAEYDQHILTDN